MWTCIGHDRAVAALQRDLDRGRPAHAYLLTGPPQIGKATLARELAQALNCEGAATDRPCGDCRACRRIAGGRHADVETLTPRSPCAITEHDHSRDGSGALRICQVRRVERQLWQAPYEGRVRVIIVDPAPALTPEAANAFLKTLEEPPPNCVLVLIATDPEALPITVRSRCRMLALGSVPTSALRRALVERWGASGDEADRLARLAQGRPGWARAALDDHETAAQRSGLLRRVGELSAAPRDERLAYAEALSARWAAGHADAIAELDAWVTWWRDALMATTERGDLCAHPEHLDAVQIAAGKLETHEIAGFVGAIRDTIRALRDNANARLALDVLMLSLPHPRTREEDTAPRPLGISTPAAQGPART